VKLASAGTLDLPVAGVFSLDRAKDAAKASAGAGRNGKVLFSNGA